MADNKMFFRPLLMNMNSWIRYTACEGECNDCEQFELCKEVVKTTKKINALFTDEELKEMGIKNV